MQIMDVSCKELRSRAWNRLKDGRYGASLGASVLGGLVSGVGSVFTAGPMSYGLADYYVSQQRGENPTIENIFCGFSRFVETFVTMLLYSIYLALWSLLIIPMYIKPFSYSMTFYVMRDFKLSGNDAITKSRELMDGYKLKLFKLYFSFIGWILLIPCTLGVGAFLLMPYLQAAEAEFYAELLKCHNINIGCDEAPAAAADAPTVEAIPVGNVFEDNNSSNDENN